MTEEQRDAWIEETQAVLLKSHLSPAAAIALGEAFAKSVRSGEHLDFTVAVVLGCFVKELQRGTAAQLALELVAMCKAKEKTR